MSTGLNCWFFEQEPERWYYLLEDWSSPKGAWDWREYASLYGPFGSFPDAKEHLNDTQPNPGGFQKTHFEEGHKTDLTVVAHLEAKRLGLSQPRFSAEAWLFEVKPGSWYALVENVQSPNQEFDWLERAIAYGPFEARNAQVAGAVMRGPGAISGRIQHHRIDSLPYQVLEEKPGVRELIERALPLPAKALEAVAAKAAEVPVYRGRSF